MTPEEAIEIIEYYYPKRKRFTCGIRIDVNDTECTFGRALTVAMQALEEIQQYRAIGTVEECREAVGEQKPKKPKEVGHENSYVVCGNCGAEIYVNNEYDKTYSVFVNCEAHRPHYCPNCGQAIRWEEIENA